MPLGVVTCTLNAAGPGAVGETALIWVGLLTKKNVAGRPPKLTPVAPVRFVPVMTTFVPPLIGPELGASAVTVGAGAT